MLCIHKIYCVKSTSIPISRVINALSYFLIGDYDWFHPVPLGMQNKLILDSQIRASSSKFLTTDANFGRLNRPTIPNGQHGGWVAADYDSNPWFQVDFIINATVSLLHVQGLSGTDHGVTKYTISFGNDGEIFSDYKISSRPTAKVRY